METNKSEQKFVDAICGVRGRFIESCIQLETMMDAYIAQYFCDTNEKVSELVYIVLAPRVSWREKLEIFKVLITRYNKKFVDDYGDFYTDILHIIEHRNVFAHFPADITPDGFKLFKEKGILPFFKFKNQKMPKTKKIVYIRYPTYTEKEFNFNLKGVYIYTVAIQKILRKGDIQAHLHP